MVVLSGQLRAFLLSALLLILSFPACASSEIFTDINGDSAPVPEKFCVSDKEDEQTVQKGLVILGEDGSEFVWVPMKEADFENDSLSSKFFFDKTDSASFRAMKESVLKYGGFYMGRYETVRGEGDVPQSRKGSASQIWVHISPQNMITVCGKLYSDNRSVTVFLPWGINWDRTLTWLVETGNKTQEEVASDSSSWGNYSNNSFGSRAYSGSGAYEETKANNIYDLAGNFWEWTQERTAAGSYAARSGGYGVMGTGCPGYRSPAAFRSGLPGNDHHPNIGFRLAMYLK